MNTADVMQIGNSHVSTVLQAGGTLNTVTLMQSGENQFSEINQIGQGNTMTITQGNN